MTFSQWLFGGIDNPYKSGQWGILHIATLLAVVVLILGFYFLVKYSRDPERTKKKILLSLAGAILFFEIMIRFVYCVKLYWLHLPEMDGITMLWILLPKPWCAVSCWAIIASLAVNKTFFYNFTSLSALLCSFIFFIYPGVGYNNVYLLFENWYSILTHALLLTTSVTMITLGYADFRYREFWKTAICFVLTFAYGFLEIYVLHTQTDPMYFMPGGDIQANILKINYGIYLTFYIVLLVAYINGAYLIGDRKNVKAYFAKRKEKRGKALSSPL
jgi:hypothetical protein